MNRLLKMQMPTLGRLLKFVAAVTVLAGINVTPAFAGFTYHIVQAASSASGSAERNFDYYVPSTYVSGTAAPLYVVLHGCRITDRTMTDLAGFEQFGERDHAIILYPFQNNDASSNDNDGRNPNCWGYWMSGNIHRDAGEVGDIKRMVDYVKSHFNVDNNRVHITGISSGGAMTTIAQVAYPDVFASSAIIEGVGYAETTSTYTGTSPCDLVLNYGLGSVRSTSSVITDMRTEMNKSVLRQPPVLVMHNKQDCTVPIKVGQSIIDAFLGLLGADGKAISSTPTSSVNGSVDGMPYTWSKYGKDANGNSLVEAVIHDVSESQVINAGVQVLSTDPWDPSGSSDSAVKDDTKRGHWWPGAAKRGPWILNKGINANQVAADFFKAHPMNGAGSTTTTTAGGTTTTTVGGTTTTTAQVTTTTTTATTTTTTVASTCYTSSNYTHVSSGRAHYVTTTGHASANGSNQDMGLYNTYVTTTLKKTGTNYYVIGTCP
jgi:poly(3-hydroxybutyrate) depolymerase